ncbi:MAG TPA: ring-cleaving dioxygenase [Bryobacteraceae bacterium]|nr:ring-cleaving dioxygenase [Bryobacteraceae bacterium]
MTKKILGIHHITAIAGDPQRNIDFYTDLLGLRLVKVTVNFDDPGSYHLYYGDGQGSPGTILTFFAWPGARQGRRGNGQVTVTSFATPQGSLAFWRGRLTANGLRFDGPFERFGQPAIAFADEDGLRLELIETAATNPARAWTGSSVPAESAIRGFHSATLSETGYQRTAALLTEQMRFRLIGQEQNRFRYEVDDGGAGKTVDVVCAPDGHEGRIAAGTVHHIAWRTADDAQQGEWLAEVGRLGYNVSPVMDRVYFHSIYFREPGGILFEIATDSPGFTVDESFEDLGSSLALPPWLEPQRARIEAALQPIKRRPREQRASS